MDKKIPERQYEAGELAALEKRFLTSAALNAPVSNGGLSAKEKADIVEAIRAGDEVIIEGIKEVLDKEFTDESRAALLGVEDRIVEDVTPGVVAEGVRRNKLEIVAKVEAAQVAADGDPDKLLN